MDHFQRRTKSFFSRSPQVQALTIFLLIMLLLTVPLGIYLYLQAQAMKQAAQAEADNPAPFTIHGNKILDPNGNPFIIKGVEMIAGRFAGGDANGLGLSNYKNAPRDLDKMKSLGINLIRLSVSADAATLPPTDPNYIPNNLYLQQMDNAVQWITQRGMVAEISQGETANFNKALQFVHSLAERYKSNPWVWIQPDNEPNCVLGDQGHCDDWHLWQQQESQYVRAIRQAGNTAPIVVNGISWSWVLDNIASYPLGDKSIIYGAHIFNAGVTSFTLTGQSGEAWCDAHWANLSTQFPIIVDRVGTYNGFTPSLTWNQGFLDFAADWVNVRQGDGVIAFVGRWSDANSLYDDQGNLNEWGTLFFDHYVTKVG